MYLLPRAKRAKGTTKTGNERTGKRMVERRSDEERKRGEGGKNGEKERCRESGRGREREREGGRTGHETE